MAYRTRNKKFLGVRYEWEKRGYTQDDFARAIGRAPSFLSSALNENRAHFSITDIRKIAEVLELPQDKIGELFLIGVPVVSAAEKPTRRVLRFVREA